ncbi:lipopolysaccharide biosynthesis protein [Cytobacillus oceanisediminis]|uniref:lipopolysaccharide biosynthesis protein n=1 Tax=Cytobacillus oceanisediminis TaxID=665099 RepID=UPI0011A5FAB4|nr:oligosaccharide flippase family protein [Cytobacillus oceanisediminis]
MNKDIRSIGINGIIYIIAALLSKGLNVALLPVYANYLTVEQFGAVSLLLLFKSIMISILGLGQVVTIKKTYYEYESAGRDFRTFFSTLLIGTFVIDLLLVIIFTSFGEELFKWFLDGVSFWQFGIYVLVSSLLIIPYQLLLKLYQTRNQSVKYSLLEILYMSLDSIISLALIIFLTMGTAGRVVGIFGSTIIITLIAIVLIKKEIKPSFEKKTYRKTLLIGLPIIPHSLSGFVINLSDRIFLNKALNLETVGIYSLGYQIGQIIDIISLAFIEAWSSYFMRYANKMKEYSLFISKFSLYYVMLTLSISVTFSLFAKELIDLFFDDKYKEAVKIIPLVVAGYAFKNVYYLSNQQLIFKEKTNLLLMSTGISAILNLILNYLFIITFNWGMYGAAFASIISFIVMSVVSYQNGQKIFYIPYYKKEMLMMYGMFTLLLTFLYLYQQLNNLLLVKIFLNLAFLLVMTLFVPKGDLAVLKNKVSVLLKKKG